MVYLHTHIHYFSQAEIKHLEEAQRRASQHRKLLLLQQEDISRCQQSTQQYKEKIRRYRLTGGINLDYSPSPSPSPSLDLHHPDVSVHIHVYVHVHGHVYYCSIVDMLHVYVHVHTILPCLRHTNVYPNYKYN